MAKVTMSLYDALTRKKIYDDRLKKCQLNSNNMFGIYSENNKTVNGLTLERAGEIMTGQFKSYIQLRKNTIALQAAINEANVTNTVVIPGYNNDEPITLVQAITVKQQLPARKEVVAWVRKVLEGVRRDIETKNARILNEEYMANQISKMPVPEKLKSIEDEDALRVARYKQYREDYTLKLFDPNNIVDSKWIETEENELANFEANLQSALTAKNVEIQIEVELED